MVSATPIETSAHPARAEAPLVVGTRGSTLALWQTNWVLDHLRACAPQARYEVATIKTQGDRTQAANVPLTQLGDKGVFIAELERALLDGALDVAVQPMQDRALAEAERRIDAAVHSLKDLPSTLTDGLTIAAVTEREDPRDALVSRAGLRLAELPEGAVVATSSLRRRAQLLHLRPDLRIVEMRGNVDTRLRKALAADGPDATILAVAGMKRLGLAEHITEYLPVETLVPAVGQGALAVEVRAHDLRARRLVRQLDSPATRQAITAERTVLATLGGGCQVPLGAHAIVSPDGQALRLLAVVASPDGRRYARVERSGPLRRPVALGRQVARELLRQGAAEILREVLAR
ncbi:MAG TPA: hydroxymethylbilane synthase [Ktedonobacterales bacterium]